MRTRVLLSVAVTVAASTAAGCSGTLSYESDVAPIFDRSCATCHAGEAPIGVLSFVDDPIDALVGVPSEQAEMNLVEPGDSLHSYLWHKLARTQGIAGGSGSTMPLGSQLDDDEVQLVADWIDDGAHP